MNSTRTVRWLVLGLFGLGLGQTSAQGLREVTPAECLPDRADYTLLWWANGWANGALRKPAVLCLQTGRYGLALDIETTTLLGCGPLRLRTDYATAAAGPAPLLPDALLELHVQVGTNVYRCVQAATNQTDWMGFPARIIESGRCVQRTDLQQLVFQDSAGTRFAGDGRLEIVAWPDRLALLLELVPQADTPDARLAMRLRVGGKDVRSSAANDGGALWRAGERQSARLTWLPDDGSEPSPITVSVTDLQHARAPVPVDYDAVRGWHYVGLPREDWNLAEQPDRLERYGVTLTNATPREQVARILWGKDHSFSGVTGLTPLLRDAVGNPTGIPVQLSKNWHAQKDRRMLYEGPWLHAFSFLRLPARSWVRLEFDLTYARWGGVPAASHAQLCLVGWGWNQLWDQVALGSWGESICYEPDAVQQRCRIDDVRPLLVAGMGKDRPKWTWTHNVGGGDFLVYFNRQGEYQPWRGVRTAYQAQGPNLTEVLYAGVTADGCIAAQIRVSSPRSDDLNRAYHHLRYDVLQPTAFSRLAFYQLGSDNYHWHQYQRLARGDGAGLREEWTPERGGKRYLRTGIPADGAAPWFSLHEGIAVDGRKPAEGAWANRGLVIRSWKARLGGKTCPPTASVFGTEAGAIPSANLELSAPAGLSELLPGDFVEADVELLVVPQAADDYYGPNENLRGSLRADANTWKPVARQAAGNQLAMDVRRGKLIRHYPPMVSVDARQSAELAITGGVGFVPVTFAGLTDYRGASLHMAVGERLVPVDQSVHGRDFWQTDYDPVSRTWRITYNVPLDSPGDVRQGVRLVFRRGNR